MTSYMQPNITTESRGSLFRADLGASQATQFALRCKLAPTESFGQVDLLLKIDASDTATVVRSEIEGLSCGTTARIFELIELGFTSRMRRLLGNCRRTGQTQRDVFTLRGFPDRHLMLVARQSPNSSRRDEIEVCGCDVSDLVIRQQAAEKQAVLLKQVLAVSPNHIFWKDKDFRFLGGNDNFVKALGVDAVDDLMGKTDYDFFPSEEADSYRAIDAAVMLGGEPILNLEERQTRDDGTEEVLLTSKVPFRNKDGEIIGILGVFEEITARKAMEDQLRHRAMRDDLTGLANRRTLLGQIDQSLHCPPAGKIVSLLFIDIDRFKIINDSLGHSVGDQLVVAIAERLAELLDNEQLLARLGGDEFAILLRTSAEEDAIRTAERIVAATSHPLFIEDTEIYTSTSIGIVHMHDHYRSANEVLRDADIAMYRAKSTGKSRYQVFDQTMFFEASREMTRHNEVRRAVEAMEFELHYQPVVHLIGQRCTGFEALIRWTPAGHQPVSPAMFVPFLEETGLIIRVGEWVIDEACRQLRAWQDKFPDMSSIHMAVNLSRIQFNSPRLIEVIVETLEKYQLAPQRLIAEITETAVAQEPQQTRGKLEELRALGVRVAMDDFGVGYSALGKLDQLPIDILKIDRSFVNRIGSDESEPLVQAILQMTRTLGLPTIAEGVEQDDQAEWLANHGCHEAQGYFYSRPLPAQPDVHPFESIHLPGCQGVKS